MKTYLITGAAGFIGGRFVESCRQKDLTLLSVDQKHCWDHKNELRPLDFGTQIDCETLFPWLEKEPPRLDGILHLGAITDTRCSDLTLLNHLNLNYSKQLWNYATKKQIPFVYASSAATYGDGTHGYDDNESSIPLLKPLNPYGESKQNFDLWALEQERQGLHPPSWSGFKFFNVYGFGERHKGFMSSVVLHAYDQIRTHGQVTLFKSHKKGIPDGFQKRDFVFVDDVVKILHYALEKPISRGIFNLGSGQARTFLDLARSTFQAMTIPEKIIFVETPESIRDKYQYFTEAKMDKLRAEGWNEPFTSLEKGVELYVQRLRNLSLILK